MALLALPGQSTGSVSGHSSRLASCCGCGAPERPTAHRHRQQHSGRLSALVGQDPCRCTGSILLEPGIECCRTWEVQAPCSRSSGMCNNLDFAPQPLHYYWRCRPNSYDGRPIGDGLEANVTAEVPSVEVHVLSSLLVHATKHIYAVVVSCHAGTSSYHLYKQPYSSHKECQNDDTCKGIRTKLWSMDTKHNNTGTHRSEIQERLLSPTPIRKFRLVKQFANGQQVPLWPPRKADLDLLAGARRPQVAGAQGLLQSSACHAG